MKNSHIYIYDWITAVHMNLTPYYEPIIPKKKKSLPICGIVNTYSRWRIE